MQSLVLIFALFSFTFAAWRLTFSNGETCAMEFISLEFQGAHLHMNVQNRVGAPIVGGNTKITTEGYGCMLFFCGWQDGPVIDLPTCSFSGIDCEGDNILGPHGAKKLNVNFTEAVVTAGKTTGCCSEDTSCKCMIRGVATFTNSAQGEYGKATMGFSCDFDKTSCWIPA